MSFRREGRTDVTPPVQRDPVQKHDVCDEVFGAFVAVARKIRGKAIEFAAEKLLPVLMHAVAMGTMKEICRNTFWKIL